MGGNFIPSMEVYHPDDNKWHELMPNPNRTGVAYINGEILVPGDRGFIRGDHSDKPRRSVYIYNIKSNTWSLSNVSLSHPQEQCGVAVIQYS